MHRNRLLYTLPEYQQKLRNNYKKCGLFLERNEDHKIFIFRPIPNCPWLPESRKKYFNKIRNRIQNIPGTHKFTFATLTYSASNYSPVGACKTIKHDIDLFFKRMGYHHRKVQYFYIIELTKQYMPHIHIVFDQFIPWKKIRSSWFHVTGNVVTDVRQKSQGEAFHHCLKYLTKMKKMGQAEWSFIFSHVDRIWSASRGFLAAASSRTGKYTFLFSVWDPDGFLGKGFENCETDLISNEIDRSDAVYIAGFSEKIEGIEVMNQTPDWIFVSEDILSAPQPKDLKISPFAFEVMFSFYDKQ